MSKSAYKTRQREELLAYLKRRGGEHITVGDVCDYFKEQGASVGQTTVYRQLERMVDEGLVGKYIIDGTSPACFEYIGLGQHSPDGVCFHCKCERCGRLIHLHCDELEAISAHLLSEHGFTLNPMRTVFYGICRECMEEQRSGGDGFTDM